MVRGESLDADVIIVGAGAAGISCAYQLGLADVKTLIIESRPRIGGRIHVELSHTSDEIRNVELGAEFMHGAPASLLGLLRRFRISFYDVVDSHHFLKGSTLLQIPDFFDRIGNVTESLRPNLKRDRSIKEFMERRKLDRDTRKLFAAYVEGFHAADLSCMGEKGLLAAGQEDEDEKNGSSIFRPEFGYTPLIRKMTDALQNSCPILMNQRARKIRWRKGRVSLFCESSATGTQVEYSSRKLVVTVPLGVLKGGSILWDPVPASLRTALSRVHMGHVQKMIFAFRERFWENLSKENPIAFLHTGPEFYFPTWWTQAPMRLPYLTAWQGGPKALEMSTWPQERRVETALTTLAKLTRQSISSLSQQLESWHEHNWSQDPFSLGAYSYIGVGGMHAARLLAKPVEKTLFFSGEATALGSTRGTVQGAIDSGLRVAKQIMDEVRP